MKKAKKTKTFCLIPLESSEIRGCKTKNNNHSQKKIA
jgi:hypothetical protein